MAVTYKTSMTKAELLEIAVVNGIAADDSMTKAAIIDALEAHNDAERDAEAAALAAQNAADSGDGPAEGNAPTAENNPADGAQNAADSGDGPAEGNDPAAENKPTQGAQDSPEGYGLFVYAGPTLPRGRLKENAVFRGTIQDVTAYLADVLEQYPQVARLIVPANKLAGFAVKVKTPGNIAHKYYNDIVSAMRNRKEV